MHYSTVKPCKTRISTFLKEKLKDSRSHSLEFGVVRICIVRVIWRLLYLYGMKLTEVSERDSEVKKIKFELQTGKTMLYFCTGRQMTGEQMTLQTKCSNGF